jgi:16S rRNA G966 N2-methylase RsmD
MNCTTDKYDALYARWLEKPGTLLDLAGYEPGQTVLDLCGGTGAVSLECLDRGAGPAEVTLLDLNPRCSSDRILSIKGDANHLGRAVARHAEGKQDEC